MTSMKRVFWEISRQYLRPYQNRRYLAYELFSDEEVKTIKEWYGATWGERQTIEAQYGSLINSYRTAVKNMGINLRRRDPDLDAWLLFFGYTTTTKTQMAEDRYYELCSQYGRKP